MTENYITGSIIHDSLAEKKSVSLKLKRAKYTEAMKDEKYGIVIGSMICGFALWFFIYELMREFEITIGDMIVIIGFAAGGIIFAIKSAIKYRRIKNKLKGAK